MAIVPSTIYPSQTSTGDPTYPHGKAKNVSVPGANDGTPFEEQWVNDLWGFLQALLDEAGITPSGTPDKLTASQYLEAILAVALPTAGGTRTLGALLKLLGAGVEIGGAGLKCTGSLVATAGAVLGGGVAIDSAYLAGGQLTGSLQAVGVGRYRRRPAVIPDIGDRTVSIADGDVLIARTVGSPCAWTISNTGAAYPDEIEIVTNDTTHITVKNAAGVALATLSTGASFVFQNARFIFDVWGDGQWGFIGPRCAP